VNDGCIEVGAWRITPLSDGTMRLDGGGMWGVVPRSLWARMTPPAADNTIPLALRPFLLQREGYTVVVEPGVGGHLPEKWARNYALDRTVIKQTSTHENIHPTLLLPGNSARKRS
jgi:hypothetical protein